MTLQDHFYDRLRAAQHVNDSWLCVGLDPLADTMGNDRPEVLLDFCRAAVDQTADLVCAYKPNLAHWLRMGGAGIDALTALIRHIPAAIPVILDAKFGDIGATAAHYRHFAFETLGVTAVTLSPYIGSDAIQPFLGDPTRGLFILARTSNVSGNEFQAVGSPSLYEQVTREVVRLSANHVGQFGLVVGATQPDELRHIRSIAPALPFLIPGIGAQGGSLEAAIRYGATSDGLGPLLTVGRALLYGDSTQTIRDRALAWQQQIRQISHASRSAQP